MRDTLGKRLLIASGVLAILVAVIFGEMLLAIGDVRDSGRHARRSQEIIASSNALQTLVLSAETSSRGYVITRQEPFLAPWKRNIAAFPAQAAALERLVGSNPEARPAEVALVADIRSYLEDYSRPLVRLARVDPTAARAVVSDGAGKRRVDAIRVLFTSLIATETSSWEHRQARADSSGRLAMLRGHRRLRGSGAADPRLRALPGAHRRAAGSPHGGRDGAARKARRHQPRVAGRERRRHPPRRPRRPHAARQLGDRALSSEVFGLAKDTTLQEDAAIAERVSDPASFMATLQAITDDPECATQDDFELVDMRRAFQRHTGPVRDSAGELIGRIIVLREITAEREAARLKSELVATVSHELRTPLTGVLGFAELLMQQDLDEDTGRRYVQTIHSEARRLTALVNDFLDVQKIEAGRFTLALESFDLGGCSSARSSSSRRSPRTTSSSSRARMSRSRWSAIATASARSSPTCSRTRSSTRPPGAS